MRSLQLSLHIISTHVFLRRVIYICAYLCFLSCQLPLMASRAVLLYIRWLRATIRHPRTAVGATLITQNEGLLSMGSANFWVSDGMLNRIIQSVQHLLSLPFR